VPVTHPGLVAAAGLAGFVGNEVVALYRIPVGRRIGSAALRADGLHARADGLTSLVVVAGRSGRVWGFRPPTPSSVC
jgi:divalent metal cation (Fe/Co/Zn/Cd) transporter